MEMIVLILLVVGIYFAWTQGKETGYKDGYTNAIREGYHYTEGAGSKRYKERFEAFF